MGSRWRRDGRGASSRSRSDDFLTAFNGSHRYVLDYLTEEVLERQPEQVRAFLLETSVLERLCAPLCEAVTGQADSQALLEERSTSTRTDRTH